MHMCTCAHGILSIPCVHMIPYRYNRAGSGFDRCICSLVCIEPCAWAAWQQRGSLPRKRAGDQEAFFKKLGTGLCELERAVRTMIYSSYVPRTFRFIHVGVFFKDEAKLEGDQASCKTTLGHAHAFGKTPWNQLRSLSIMIS